MDIVFIRFSTHLRLNLHPWRKMIFLSTPQKLKMRLIIVFLGRYSVGPCINAFEHNPNIYIIRYPVNRCQIFFYRFLNSLVFVRILAVMHHSMCCIMQNYDFMIKKNPRISFFLSQAHRFWSVSTVLVICDSFYYSLSCFK